MRCLLLASIVVLALGADSAPGDSAPGDSAHADWAHADWAHGDWRTYGAANRTNPGVVWQWGYGQRGYGWYPAYGDWRTYGTANRISPNGVWWRGYGRFGYGWYSIYGQYIGNNYSTIGYGFGNRSAGFNFNRTDNYGFPGPPTSGYRP